MHVRRYFFKALESDKARMGPAMHPIARLQYLREMRGRGALCAESMGCADSLFRRRWIGWFQQYFAEAKPASLGANSSGEQDDAQGPALAPGLSGRPMNQDELVAGGAGLP